MTRKSYRSDLTDEQWLLIEPLIPPDRSGTAKGGRPREVVMREVINALVYLNRTGCPWRAIPHELPPWGTVADYFYRFRDDGTWQKIHDRLREQVRVAADREPTPSVAIIDSRSVKTTEKGGSAVMTGTRRSRAASGISSWTRWD